MNKITVFLKNSKINDYYELNKIFKRNGINSEIINKETSGSELGVGFDELIILLPVLTPTIIEFRKCLEAYFSYKKPQNTKTSIVLEKNDKKMHITYENESLPSIEELYAFFNED